MPRKLLLAIAVLSLHGFLGTGCAPEFGSCDVSATCVASFGNGYVCRAGMCEQGCDTEEDCAYIGPGHMCMSNTCMGMDVAGPTLLQPDVTPETRKVGDVELWEIRNETDIDHPFHLHGQFFQVQSRQADEGLGWMKRSCIGATR